MIASPSARNDECYTVMAYRIMPFIFSYPYITILFSIWCACLKAKNDRRRVMHVLLKDKQVNTAHPECFNYGVDTSGQLIKRIAAAAGIEKYIVLDEPEPT